MILHKPFFNCSFSVDSLNIVGRLSLSGNSYQFFLLIVVFIVIFSLLFVLYAYHLCLHIAGLVSFWVSRSCIYFWSVLCEKFNETFAFLSFYWVFKASDPQRKIKGCTNEQIIKISFIKVEEFSILKLRHHCSLNKDKYESYILVSCYAEKTEVGLQGEGGEKKNTQKQRQTSMTYYVVPFPPFSFHKVE